VDALAAALRHIAANKEQYQSQYHLDAGGEYAHNTFRFDSRPLFSARDEANRWLAAGDGG